MNTLVKNILSASAFLFAIGAVFASTPATSSVWKRADVGGPCLVTQVDVSQLCQGMQTVCSITTSVRSILYQDQFCSQPFLKNR